MTPLFSPSAFFYPQLSPGAQGFIRVAYGFLMMGTLLLALPHWERFFMSERWGGYAQSTRSIDAIQNPIVSRLASLIWISATVLLTFNKWTVAAAFVNLVLCYYFFVRMRWKGILRGMGAPGFMSYWLAAAIFLLELTSHYAADLRPLTLLLLQVDFALIMFSSGIYKLTAGYAQNHGMEGGMVNPQWGYWWWLYQKVAPQNPIFKFLNHMAWSLEVLAAIFMLFPPMRFIGGLLMLGSFVFIATQIRLGLLCEMVIVCCLLFFHPASYGDQLLSLITPALAASAIAPHALPLLMHAFLAIFLWGYLILLPVAHAGLFYNFYARKSLPRVIQRALEAYTNCFGIIIWRVFSADHTNFFIRVYRRPRKEKAGPRTLLSRTGLRGALRYNHVAESIVITTLFTTLKYYPSNSEIFRERLLRYARTLACPENSVLEFEYVTIRKRAASFEFLPVVEYTVDVTAGTVSERQLDENFSARAPLSLSPVREGIRPGSYVPLKS